MKLRLEIITHAGAAQRFEHDGPHVRLGRDPENELALAGDAAHAVSWQHAEIELTVLEAFISDCNSTNGTFVNDRRIDGRTLLHVGDVIQLGATGPVLKVLGLDRSVRRRRGPLPAETPANAFVKPYVRPDNVEDTVQVNPADYDEILQEDTVQDVPEPNTPWLAYSAAGIAVVAILALLFLMLWRNQRPAAGDAQAAPAEAVAKTNPAPPVAPKQEPATVAAVSPEPKPVAPAPAPAPEAAGLTPSVDRREVGTFTVPPRSPPSVLLQREPSPYPWSPVRAGERVATSQHLVSLPGYRSRIDLDSGVRLALWGNVPEFSAFPVLESAVMLHAPPPGIDLDFTLERGRVHLAQHKAAGEARVRVRFQRESWDLTLPNAQSEVVLELWNMLPEETPAPSGKEPLTVVGLFTNGPATLKAGGRELSLKPLSRLTWMEPGGALQGPETMAALPDWWVKGIEPKTPQIGDAMLALQDYSAILNKSTALVDSVLTQVRESPDAPHRSVGVLFLGALDAAPHLVDALDERQYAEVRGAAIQALRHWLRQSADHEQELFRILIDKRGYAKEKADLIVKLLRGFSKQEAARPETYAQLVADLDHENLGVRHLAYWHLAHLAPREARKVPYDPAGAPEDRKKAAAGWKKALPPGSLPARS